MKKKMLMSVCGLMLTLAVTLPGNSMDVHAETVSGSCGENVTWTFNDETQELVLSGSGAMADGDYDTRCWKEYEDVIKSVVVESGITTIGDYAFYSFDELERVILPDGITSIGEHAFSYTKVGSVDLPESLKRIEANAFDGCEELVDMALPEGIEFLGRQAFAGCENWENGDIPSSVKELGAAVFQGCMKLEYAVIPDGITSVPSHMFSYCQSLRSVQIPNSVTLIEDMAFSGCYSLQNIVIPNGVTVIERNAFSDCKRLTEVTIPNGVTSLPSRILSRCVALKKVNLPDSITYIGLNAFDGCKALTSIVLPKGLKEMPAGTFLGCGRLTSILLPETLEVIANDNFTDAVNLFRMTIDSKAVLQAIADPELDEGILEYPKTVYIKADINNVLDMTQYGYSKTGEIDKDGKHYIIYADHAHNESGCAACMTTGIEFNDVKVSDYYYSPVIWAADEGVTAGLTPNAFGPNEGCTRAQVVTFLWRAMDCPKVTPQQNFTDVPEGSYYYEAVHWAANNGITYGYGDGKFGSEDMVTRAQFVSFLWRLKGQKKAECENPFKDLAKDAYYYDAVLWAVEKGITAGLYPDQFAPNATCTRGQVVSFIFRTGQWEVDQLKIVFPG